jgi:hypothetical protein
MYILKNKELSVEIIDPENDRQYFGSRYCTGCYIFQVKDKNNNLLSGPVFNDTDFNVFHGQGAPEVFSIALNVEHSKNKEDVLVIGVGNVIRTSSVEPFHVRDNPIVREFCNWKVDSSKDSIAMETLHQFKSWQFIVKKQVTLINKSVTSQTEIENMGKETVPVKWFAHPFFPFPPNYVTCKFSMPFRLYENEGYKINDNGYIEMNSRYDWKKGLYQKIEYNHEEKFSVFQRHPVSGMVSVETDFIPTDLAIWANDKTFSFEPFWEKVINGGHREVFSIKYTF